MMGRQKIVNKSPATTVARTVRRKYLKRASRVQRQLFQLKTTKTSKVSNTTPPDDLLPEGDDFRPILLENAVIKGYHVYKIHPPETVPVTHLTVDREYTNIHDVNSCLVWIPPIDSFSERMRGLITDPRRQLRLEDVAGLPVGHVPRGLAGSFRQVMDAGGIVTAEITGEPVPSYPPWPAPSEKGGGVVIPCNYFIVHRRRQWAFNALREALLAMPEVEVMRLE